MMGTRLKVYVDRSLFKQRNILDRRDGIHLGMGLTVSLMIALANDLVIVHDHRTNQWVRGHLTASEFSQLKTATHVLFIHLHVGKSSSKERFDVG
jgi:hypothetical protein